MTGIEMQSGYDVHVLFSGYSKLNNDGTEMEANCTCTLLKGANNIIVDTMTAWDKNILIKGLSDHDIKPQDIHYVICTHGHSDHIGNNNLFENAKHIVGYSISYKTTYFIHPFDEGKHYKIDDHIQVIPTPGHTLSDVSVIVKTRSQETFAITGDLFERHDDVQDPKVWKEAGSEDPKLQIKNRSIVANLADWIVPGHGPPFKVTQEVRETLLSQFQQNEKL